MSTVLNNQTVPEQISCFHLFRSTPYEKIFVDEQDFQTFIKYLKEYFSNNDPENKKITFSIRGRVYRGTPHLPQNYSSQIEILAYKLDPNRFDLVIKELVPGAIQKFIRALSTRYAIYYNKRYQRSGSLFNDSYKQVKITDQTLLPHVIRDLLNNTNKNEYIPVYYYSSNPEYLDQRVSESIKIRTDIPNQEFNNLNKITGSNQPEVKINTTIPQLKTKTRIPEIIFSTALLVVLTSYSIMRIETPLSSTTPLKPYFTNLENNVLGDDDSSEKQNKEKVVVVINASDNLNGINIYKEPSSLSPIIGKAKVNNSYEFVSENSGWYQVKLYDGSTGYVSSRYSEIRKNNLND